MSIAVHSTAEHNDREIDSPWLQALITTVLPSAVVPVALAVLFDLYLESARWANEPLHSLVEGVGSFAAILLALLIVIMRDADQLRPGYIWVATTLMGMGLLDGFHAGVAPGKEFIWLHSLATLIGGLTFSLVVLPERIARAPRLRSAPYLMAAVSVVLGIGSILFPEWIPQMAGGGAFSVTAEWLNVLGGTGFIIAWLHFTRQGGGEDEGERLLLANHCLLFGMAGLLFHFSTLWDPTWWLWHLLRLFAYLVILWFFLGIYYQEMQRVRSMDERMRLTKLIFDHTGEGIVITDAQSRILDVNDAYVRITGFSREELIGLRPNVTKSGRHDGAFYAAMWRELVQRGSWSGEIWDRRKGGEVYPKWTTINAIRDEQGRTSHYVGIFTDISEKKNSQKQLENLAFYDPLTHLPNRLLFRERLDRALAASRRHGDRTVLMFIDLDRFKDVNDTLGHDAGDKLLVQVAARIQERVRQSDVVARLGGDEFTVILGEMKDAGAAGKVAQEIIRRLQEPFGLDGREVFVGASIGISVYPEDGEGSEALLKNADTAMYHAKESGRGRFQFFRAEMNEKTQRRVLLDGRLRRALDNREFLLHYQPKIELGSGRVSGVEALVRWLSPEEGLVSPVEFIPLAEENNLILPLGEWVLRSACAQVKEWERCGLGLLRVAVNLSARQFHQQDLPRIVGDTLSAYGLPADALELEITESVVMESPQEAADQLMELRDMGVHISIDDFGTGYSSLAYLKRFPIHSLKIDRSFVQDLPEDADDAAIVDSIIAMARGLHLRVVAEGVENEGHCDFLLSRGCDEAQGFHFSRPLPPGELEEWLRRR